MRLIVWWTPGVLELSKHHFKNGRATHHSCLCRPQEVVVFGTTTGLLGITTLAATVNPITAVLGMLFQFCQGGINIHFRF